MLAVEQAFRSRTDLHAFGNNARLLFALQLHCDIEDIHSIAATALVDNGTDDDKKCDLVYIDEDRGVLIVAQGYEAQDPTRPAAPSNKASDLNTGVTWLLSREITELPQRLQTVAYEVRRVLGAGDIDSIQFWYVHNLPESTNVRQELLTVEQTLHNTIRQRFPDHIPREMVAIEAGINIQEEWYQSLSTPIRVAENFTLTVPGAFELGGAAWHACMTTVRAADLYDLYQAHKADLFSANYRDYLGSSRRRRLADINTLIKESAQHEPGKFWVFNNGVTAIVGDFAIESVGDGTLRITIAGISIVNGAQTTGSIGTLANRPSADAMVPMRFIKCSEAATIHDIVRFNNSQNPLLPSDYKSNDEVQRRLRDEFAGIRHCNYTGGRRGLPVDRLSPAADILAVDTCAQALAALHQRPDIAYHKKADMWRDNELYCQFFNQATSAKHVLFAFSLLKAIESRKTALRNKELTGQLLGPETAEFEFLCKRGATLLLATGIAASLDTILNTPVTNRFGLSFGDAVSRVRASELWIAVVEAVAPFAPQMIRADGAGMLNTGQVGHSVTAFSQYVSASATVLRPVFEEFGRHVARA